MAEVYNKLVRDKIPQLIRQQGDMPTVAVLDDARYLQALRAKLCEEVAEYFEAFSVEELADIVEVVYALVRCHGLSLAAFEELRLKKLAQRGGFADKIELREVQRKDTE